LAFDTGLLDLEFGEGLRLSRKLVGKIAALGLSALILRGAKLGGRRECRRLRVDGRCRSQVAGSGRIGGPGCVEVGDLLGKIGDLLGLNRDPGLDFGSAAGNRNVAGDRMADVPPRQEARSSLRR